MDDFSIDLETLGTRFDAPILSIGAAQFDRHTGEIGKTFYREILVDSAIRHGVISGDTLRWWMNQGEAAKRVFGTENKHQLQQALVQLSAYLPQKHGRVWGNGSSFDITILEHAYATCNLPPIWKFWDIRDMRTAVDMGDYQKGTIPFEGTAHNALDDAVHQAKVIARCFANVRRSDDDLV